MIISSVPLEHTLVSQTFEGHALVQSLVDHESAERRSSARSAAAAACLLAASFSQPPALSTPSHANSMSRRDLDDLLDSRGAEVVPGLFIGERRLAADLDALQTLGVTHAVNATVDIRHYFSAEHVREGQQSITYMRCAWSEQHQSDERSTWPLDDSTACRVLSLISRSICPSVPLSLSSLFVCALRVRRHRSIESSLSDARAFVPSSVLLASPRVQPRHRSRRSESAF